MNTIQFAEQCIKYRYFSLLTFLFAFYIIANNAIASPEKIAGLDTISCFFVAIITIFTSLVGFISNDIKNRE